ncbi:MAG: tyrosine--tRNA ligase [Candidatus Aenigmarchaeota archaeon]|nr:tyrosine--tRNA ligase [Candidatus Aenigmarchaeota archaeon]
METEKRVELVKQVGEEIITEAELRELFETKSRPVAYDGFEPSGRMHIAQGILRAINVNKMIKAGAKFKMLVADWHSWANNKLGGDLDKIHTAGDYMLEVWKAAGMDTGKIEFVRSSDLLKNESYWKTTMQVARNSTVKRVVRCAQIMGRKESESLSASQILYPCMQTADIFELKCDITQLGMDQRKVNMLAREIGLKLGFWKPVVVSHHMLMGLGKPASGAMDAVEKAIEMKMSKSRPDTAIFMDDSEKEIRRKISKAYCPEKQVEENPVMEYCKYIIFEKFPALEVQRPPKFGGDMSIGSYEELVKLYKSGKLHPMDLKNAVAEHINQLVEPVRKRFEKNARARKLLAEVRSFEVTR